MKTLTQKIEKLFKVNEVNAMINEVETSDVKRFHNNLKLSYLLSEALENFKSAEGKSLMKQSGKDLNTEEFFWEFFKLSKSFAYRLIKASKIDIATVNEFEMYCETRRDDGEPCGRNIDELIKFAKEGKDSDTKEKTKVLLQLNYDGQKLTIDENGTAKGDIDIAKAIELLTALLNK